MRLLNRVDVAKEKGLFEGSSTRLHPFVVESKALYKPKVISQDGGFYACVALPLESVNLN